MRLTLDLRNLTRLLDTKSLSTLERYSQFHPSPLSLSKMVEFGKIASPADSFVFLKHEVPIRMSNILKEMTLLPPSFLNMPSIIVLQDWYAQTFQDIISYEDREPTPRNLEEFLQTLKTAAQRHVNVVQTTAQGVLEMEESKDIDEATEIAVHYFLDRFYMSRISMRMLINQHMLLFDKDASRNPKRVGMIDPKCKVRSTVMEAFNHASFICEDLHNTAPDIEVTVHNNSNPGRPVMITYPPPHLYHILFELFKNSMRAVVETHKGRDLPDVKVLVVGGEHDVSIRVTDEGGGIPRHITDQLFQYHFSTAPRPSMTPTRQPLAGYGYGLPLSRLYARYFHGDLILNSYDGYGTEAIVYLKTQDAVELLPVYNKTSRKQYNTVATAADWTDMSYSFPHQPTREIVAEIAN